MAEKYISFEAAITAMTADNLLEHFDSVEDVIENRFHRAAERILASIPAADVLERPRWVPVTERLPNGEVIAINAMQGTYGYREYLLGYIGEDEESDSGYSCESEGEILMNVTHWMPLPDPPMEGAR